MSQLLILLKSKQALDSKIPDSQDFGVFLPPFSQNWFKGFQGPVRTNAFPKVCVFVVIEHRSKHRSIRVHTTVLMRYRLSTLKRLKTIELHVVKYVLLYAHAADTRACDIFGHHFHFDVFSTVQTNTTCVRFRFDPLSTAFSNRCVFFMKMLGVLVLTERLNASKCTRFETKTH